MNSAYNIIRTLVRTEKGTMLEGERKYLFQVDSRANKIQIKKAVEELYKVHVQDVNTSNVPGKSKVVRREAGFTTAWKKAIVTLKDGQKIEVT